MNITDSAQKSILQPRNKYVVVIRSGSRLRFAPEEQLEIKVNGGRNVGVLTFRTRYSDEGFEDPIPRELWIDARGYADSLVEAIEVFTNTANTLVTIISFCMNGYAGECQFHLGYEDTPEKKEREFFEQFVQDEKGLPLPSRTINSQLVLPVIETIPGHQFHDRLMNAMVQYVLAIEYWKRGSETLSTAHLFMGMESLVRVARHYEMNKLGLASTQELADAWGIPLEELDSKIRRDILFESDQETHGKAKKASDGMEHGYLSFTEVRPLAEAVRNKTAAYLRRSIIKLLTLPEDIEQKLLSHPYDQPIGTIGYVRYLRGELIAEHDQLAAEGQMYPLLDWRFSVKSFSQKDNKLKISFHQSFTPRIGDRVSFRPLSVEIYGPEGVISESTTPQQIEPEIIHESENIKRNEVIDLMEKIWKTVSAYGSDRFIEVSIVNLAILVHFSRCKRQFHSALALLKQGLPTEALTLSRSLWVNSLFLSQIASSEHKAAIVHGLELENLKKVRAKTLHAFNLRPSQEVQHIIDSNEMHWKILSDSKRKLKIKKLQVPEHYLISASKLCSPDSYQLLIESEQIISGSMLVDVDIKAGDEENKLLIDTHSFSFKKTALLSGLVTEAILLSCKSVASIFNWEEMSEMENYSQVANKWLKTESAEG